MLSDSIRYSPVCTLQDVKHHHYITEEILELQNFGIALSHIIVRAILSNLVSIRRPVRRLGVFPWNIPEMTRASFGPHVTIPRSKPKVEMVNGQPASHNATIPMSMVKMKLICVTKNYVSPLRVG